MRTKAGNQGEFRSATEQVRLTVGPLISPADGEGVNTAVVAARRHHENHHQSSEHSQDDPPTEQKNYTCVQCTKSLILKTNNLSDRYKCRVIKIIAQQLLPMQNESEKWLEDLTYW